MGIKSRPGDCRKLLLKTRKPAGIIALEQRLNELQGAILKR
jgi:hypothetical protein